MIFFCLTNLNDRYFAIYNYNWFIWILVQVFIIFAWFCFTKIANQCKWMHDAYIVLILFAHCMYIIHWNDCNNYILHIPDLIVSMIFIRDVAIAIWSEKKGLNASISTHINQLFCLVKHNTYAQSVASRFAPI